MKPTGIDADNDVVGEIALVEAARRRMRRELVADRGSGLLTGGSFLVVAVAWLLLAPPSSLRIGMFVACVAAYVVAGCAEFEIGPGCALPTTPVQVVMLFVLPPPLVPLAVLAGLAGSSRVAQIWDPARRERFVVLAASGWQVVGPAAVFAVAHVRRPELSAWYVYVLALGAQFAVDAAVSWIRNCYGLGVSYRQLTAALGFAFVVDLCLAPVGLTAALAVPGSPGALVLLMPPTLLLVILEADRRRQLDQTVALGAAFADTSDLARRDALTGVSNRLAFEESTARYRESDTPVGVILADVDGLKAANDTYGHAMGDALLVAVADALVRGASTATTAPVFRIGGDEFAVVVPQASRDAAEAIAAAMRAAIHHAPPVGAGEEVRVSASVGVGFAASGRTLSEAIARADREVNTEKSRRGIRR